MPIPFEDQFSSGEILPLQHNGWEFMNSLNGASKEMNAASLRHIWFFSGLWTEKSPTIRGAIFFVGSQVSSTLYTSVFARISDAQGTTHITFCNCLDYSKGIEISRYTSKGNWLCKHIMASKLAISGQRNYSDWHS